MGPPAGGASGAVGQAQRGLAPLRRLPALRVAIRGRGLGRGLPGARATTALVAPAETQGACAWSHGCHSEPMVGTATNRVVHPGFIPFPGILTWDSLQIEFHPGPDESLVWLLGPLCGICAWPSHFQGPLKGLWRAPGRHGALGEGQSWRVPHRHRAARQVAATWPPGGRTEARASAARGDGPRRRKGAREPKPRHGLSEAARGHLKAMSSSSDFAILPCFRGLKSGLS